MLKAIAEFRRQIGALVDSVGASNNALVADSEGKEIFLVCDWKTRVVF